MANNFRSEIFNLCKKIQQDNLANDICELIYRMSITSMTDDSGKEIKVNKHGDLAYVAKSSKSEFHGFLFVDDNVEKIELPQFFKVNHLEKEERELIEKGHLTLLRFIDLCLSDISIQSELVAKVLNPYSVYQEVHVNRNIKSILSDEDMKCAVDAFKNGKVYKALMDSNFTKLFSKIKLKELQVMLSIIEKEINNSLNGDVTNDLKEFSMKLHSRLTNINDVIFAFSILMYALKESLKLSCHLLYISICGADLLVLDNDNIINIEERTANVLFKTFSVLSQNTYLDPTGSLMGSVGLIDCDLPNDTHIYEFGMIIRQTLTLQSEFGNSARYTMVSVNGELIFINVLTNALLDIGLPVINEKPQ